MGSGDILAILREQATLYRKLESFASKQRALVSLEEPGPLLMLLADRQRLSIELGGVSRRFEPIRQNWSAHRERLSVNERAEADALLSDIGGRLRRVIESDEQDARVLAARKETVASALRSTHVTGRAISAYQTAPMGSDTTNQWDEPS